MTREELENLEALSAAATPAPWYATFTDDMSCMTMVVVSTTPDIDPHGDFDDVKHLIAATLLQPPRYVDVADGRWDQNADFIVALRNKLPELIALAREALVHRAHPQTTTPWCGALTRFPAADPGAGRSR